MNFNYEETSKNIAMTLETYTMPGKCKSIQSIQSRHEQPDFEKIPFVRRSIMALKTA